MGLFEEMLIAIQDFMERGGPVLWLIALLLFVLWSLMFERLWFLNSVHKKNTAAALAEWEKRNDKRSWHAHAIRQELISRVSLDLKSTMPIIEVLVVVCPLLGLLGTVTGMIEVFYVMAVTGGGDAKQMSGGVAKATIPTMAGMVGALSGIFSSNWLKSKTNREIELLEDHLTIQHA
ncbi:MAG: biopolymer transporter ExbB [Gammaproteobacteria bacterium]|nr:biopolymer transporter ExbB [Gammaproteobacteria bacterium]MAY01505.1 biopolymer transporter ExbB [Gammaproteobacteria bacterium]|tara:strand:- start:322 stop:852 length:531 start_codon:yes stop_codon:yes gene_type:complete